jgi:hypothetical protein
MKISESFWAAVGKIGAIAGLLATLVGLWTLYSAPRGDLVADLRFGPQFWPPAATVERQKILELVEPERLAQLVSEPAEEQEASHDAEKVREELGYRLRQYIRESDIGEYTRLGGYWIADVRNEGDLSVESAAINLPGAVVAVTAPSGDIITHSGEFKPASVDSGVVQLGTLRPNGKVRVIAWTVSEPSDFSVRDVVLSHQGGVGSLAVYSMRPPLAVSIRNNWPLLLLPGWLLLCGGAILFFWLRQQRKVAEETEHRGAGSRESMVPSEKDDTEESPANPIG